MLYLQDMKKGDWNPRCLAALVSRVIDLTSARIGNRGSEASGVFGIHNLQVKHLNLKTGDILVGKTRRNNPTDKFGALVHLETINGFAPEEAAKRKNFEDLTPIFPNERIRLEQPGSSVAMRIVDLVSPIGKGQRGMIVSQPKAGKTTLLKEIAKSVTTSYPDMHLIILLMNVRKKLRILKSPLQGIMWKLFILHLMNCRNVTDVYLKWLSSVQSVW